MPEQRSYGTSRSGVELTDEVIESMADQAEAGLDVSKLRRRPGRPLMGAEPAKALPVRFDPELRQAIEQRAQTDGVTAGAVVRQALREYLRSA
ncbi:MAG: CopG family transcriptional regulator [Actinomycetota bacterium]|nr:CopG family transcriptional regulator [Actinomycetota bacterium]